MQLELRPNKTEVMTAVTSFLRAVLPSGTPVRQGESNRAPEPKLSDFVVFWALMIPRLDTNVHEYTDGVFTGSLAGATLTITAVNLAFAAQLKVGSTIFGIDVLDDTVITAILTGTGGIGTYTVSKSQTLSSRVIATGTEDLMQSADFQVQVEVHGPNSATNAAIISTIFGDQRSIDLFASTPNICPLYAGDPSQVPFQNAEQQWEIRLITTLHLQVNYRLTLPQQYADVLTVTLIDASLPL